MDLAGGPEALLAKARTAYEAGDYRWVAELVNHLVFADPANMDARNLQADALEQLGYQAESGPWRAFYLTGALELRHPRPPMVTPRQGAAGQIRNLPADELLDALSVRLNGEKAGTRTFAFDLTFTDTGERFGVSVENAVLHHGRDRVAPAAQIVHLTRAALVQLTLAEASVAAAVEAGSLKIEGDTQAFGDFVSLLDQFDFWFEIIC